MIVLIVLLVGVVISAFWLINSATTTNDQSTQPTLATPEASACAANPLPNDEKEFLLELGAFATEYQAAPNEFQKSALRVRRAQSLARLLPNPSVQNWIGRISSMQTTSDGSGVLCVQLAGNTDVKIETWNNALSDVRDNTLIAPGSPLYKEISGLAEGEGVSFSGTFVPNEMDYIREASVTEEGSMTEPEFLFRFSAVAKIDRSSQ